MKFELLNDCINIQDHNINIDQSTKKMKSWNKVIRSRYNIKIYL